ncbi:MAG: hypothetical protein V4539_04915 [Bacteroidota bacterium]
MAAQITSRLLFTGNSQPTAVLWTVYRHPTGTEGQPNNEYIGGRQATNFRPT